MTRFSLNTSIHGLLHIFAGATNGGPGGAKKLKLLCGSEAIMESPHNKFGQSYFR
ncbi:hypothetical protein R8510_04689 [Ralstonia chuxiongensis]|nr:hypothetical protein R8510_04689 [Ralstonia chuxiongensis]